MRWQLDNAKEHHAKIVLAYWERLGIIGIWTKDYSPDANGSVESFNKWSEYDYAARQEHYLHRPKTRDGKLRPVPGAPMTWSEFLADYGDFVYHYNHRHIHSAIGCTPAEEWNRLAGANGKEEPS